MDSDALNKLARNKSITPKGRNKIFGRLVKKHLSEKELFEERYMPEPNSGCWLWILSGPGGYGYFVYNKKQRFAHRAAWEIYNGTIPDKLLVCHKCDTPSCVNPNHLFLGTHDDNVQDMMNKKRNRPPMHTFKLNKEQVLEIYKSNGLHKDIAKVYGVCREMVSQIKRGATWNHVTNHKLQTKENS